MAIILTERAKTLSLAKTYQERYQLQSVELAAKSELISLSKAIDAAAAKGEESVAFKLSQAITKLSNVDRITAETIIEEDILAAGYTLDIVKDKNDLVTGYNVGWTNEGPGGESSEDEPISEEDLDHITDDDPTNDPI